jgi:hypothetical protein
VLLISSGHLEIRFERFSAPHAEVSPGLLIAVEVVRRPTVPAKGNGIELVEIIDGLDAEYARAALMSPTTSRPKQQTAPKLTKIERTVMPLSWCADSLQPSSPSVSCGRSGSARSTADVSTRCTGAWYQAW